MRLLHLAELLDRLYSTVTRLFLIIRNNNKVLTEMSKEMCRLCLSSDDLGPIFVDGKHSDRYTTVLELTTSLKIKPNDGLPQQICSHCTDSVKTSLSFRETARSSEIHLLNLGYKLTKIESNFENADKEEQNGLTETELNDENEKSSDDYKDFSGLPELKVEIQLDRLTDEKEDGDSEIEAKVDNTKQPNKKIKDKGKISRKEKKAMYLNLVDGVLDPKGPVKCKICKKSLSKWSCFISHAKLHLGFKYMCEFCGKNFISSTQLKRHCRSYHGLQRELACKQCDYLALDSAQLILHERRVHTGERPYVCDVCAASYHSRRCLVQHIESHRTTASVQCDQCSQLFKSRRHLARHRYSAHARSTRATCPVCARTYSRKYIRAHIVKHHPEATL